MPLTRRCAHRNTHMGGNRNGDRLATHRRVRKKEGTPAHHAEVPSHGSMCSRCLLDCVVREPDKRSENYLALTMTDTPGALAAKSTLSLLDERFTCTLISSGPTKPTFLVSVAEALSGFRPYQDPVAPSTMTPTRPVSSTSAMTVPTPMLF